MHTKKFAVQGTCILTVDACVAAGLNARCWSMNASACGKHTISRRHQDDTTS